MVKPIYCADNDRPSVDPVVLFKMVLIQHLYGLTSLCRTAEQHGMRYTRYTGLAQVRNWVKLKFAVMNLILVLVKMV